MQLRNQSAFQSLLEGCDAFGKHTGSVSAYVQERLLVDVAGMQCSGAAIPPSLHSMCRHVEYVMSAW